MKTIQLIHNDNMIAQKEIRYPAHKEKIIEQWEKLYGKAVSKKCFFIINDDTPVKPVKDETPVKKQKSTYKKGSLRYEKVFKKNGKNCNNMRMYNDY